MRVRVSAEISDGPSTEDSLGADALVNIVDVGDVEPDAARGDSGGLAGGVGKDGSSTLDGRVFRESENGRLREGEGDDLVAAVAVTTAIADGPRADDLRGSGAVETGALVSEGDGGILAVVRTNGSTSGIGLSGRSISAVASDVLREFIENGLGGVTDSDGLHLTSNVTADISDFPITGDGTIATSGENLVIIKGDVDVRASVLCSGGGTSDEGVVDVIPTVDSDGRGESDERGDSAIEEGEELVARYGVTAGISSSPGAKDGLITGVTIGEVLSSDIDGVTAISGIRDYFGETGSALKGGVGGEGTSEDGRSAVKEGDGLGDVDNVAATVVGGERTEDLSFASIDGGGNVRGSDSGSETVARVDSSGAAENSDGGSRAALKGDIFRDVTDDRGCSVEDEDLLSGRNSRCATVSN